MSPNDYISQMCANGDTPAPGSHTTTLPATADAATE